MGQWGNEAIAQAAARERESVQPAGKEEGHASLRKWKLVVDSPAGSRSFARLIHPLWHRRQAPSVACHEDQKCNATHPATFALNADGQICPRKCRKHGAQLST
ncbi:hypothetical protein LPJ57_002314 [Coemansia sp. RSA 486]|nr:hypothetical protein LPJ57_002314 [Coemansia sp. RSA 486]